MSTLHDRLADLAEEAPTAEPMCGARDALWERGLRYRRVRRAGTLAVVGAAVLALVLLGGVTLHRAAPPVQPARGSVGLPDRVWTPSPWLATTDRPGQLVAIATTDRGGWNGSHTGLAGISATTQDYAFLDLPALVDEPGDGPALSPDGRHVAYWTSGGTTGTPYTGDGTPIAGVAVYDVGSGHVVRHRIETAHGLRPQTLVWADAATLVFSGGQIMGGDDAPEPKQMSARAEHLASWPLGGRPSPIPGAGAGGGLESYGHGRILVGTSSRRPERQHRLIDLQHPAASRFVRLPESSPSIIGASFYAFDASGRRVALVEGNANPGKVHAGRIGHVRLVPHSSQTFAVLDWVGSGTLVTLRTGGVRRQQGTGVYAVSLATGASRRLVRNSSSASWQFATDLLGAPSVHAQEPPRPLDPRVMTGLAIGTVLAAIAGLVLWRRRARP